MTLTGKTKIGLTFGQIITLITYTIFVVWLYAGIKMDIAKMQSRQDECEKNKTEQNSINEKLTNSTQNIEKSLIRIEGKMDLKADKNWTK